MKLYHAAVKQYVFNRQQQTKSRYDRNRPNPRYDLSTTVLTRLFFNKSKLDPVFSTTPKIVIEQQHPVYWVKDINTNFVSRVHVNDIRPIILPSPHSQSSVSPTSMIIHSLLLLFIFIFNLQQPVSSLYYIPTFISYLMTLI